MKHPSQDEIDALNRLTAGRQRGFVDSKPAPKTYTPKQPEGFLRPQPKKPRNRPSRSKKKVYHKPNPKKYYDLKPMVEAKQEAVWIERLCLRCNKQFEAPDRYTRLCSEYCRQQEGAFGGSGNNGRHVQAKGD